MKTKHAYCELRMQYDKFSKKKKKSSNDGAEYCILLKSGKTHLIICVLQMVLRYSDVGGVYHW